MAEGNVYLCDKKKIRGKYVLELMKNKKIRVEGSDLEGCEIELYDQILQIYGDGEAILEYLPPKSKKMPTGVYLYSAVGYNDSVTIKNADEIFEGEVCDKCNQYIHCKRTEVPMSISIKRKPGKAVLGTYGLRNSCEVYSEFFINLLSDEEKQTFETRPVLYKGEATGYIEIFPKKIISRVGHKGAKEHFGWKCSKCGNRRFSVIHPELYHNHEIFIAPETIDSKSKLPIFITKGDEATMAFPNERWAELLQHKQESKGANSHPVVVLESEYIDYSPELPEIK